MSTMKYKVKPSKPDTRDLRYIQKQSTILESVDLREWDSPVEDQDKLGSCVANAITSAYELAVKRWVPSQFVELSRLFVYYNSRLFDNTLTEDVGAYIRDGLKAVKQYGVCQEKLWPYDITKFDDQPTPECYVDAAKRTISEYRALVSLRDMLETLTDSKPIVVGMVIYSDFDYVDNKNPVVQMPTSASVSTGSHAVVILGYDLKSGQFLIKNSYGTSWGFNGYAWVPFEYLRTQGFEKWTFNINVRSIDSNTQLPVTQTPQEPSRMMNKILQLQNSSSRT